MPLEIKDPATGQIKTWVIVASGGGILLLMLLMRGSGGASTVGEGSSEMDPRVSGGQSSGITNQLADLQQAVNNLANNPATGSTPTTPTTNPGGTVPGSTTGGTGTGSSGNTNTGSGNTTPTPRPVPTWLSDLLNRLGGGFRVNPTNPISPITFPTNTAPYNGALPIPIVGNIFDIPNWLASHRYVSIQPIGDISEPTGAVVPNLRQTAIQRIEALRTTTVIPSSAGVASMTKPVRPRT